MPWPPIGIINAKKKKMPVVPKLIYRSNLISIKISEYFAEIDELIRKYIWTCKGPRQVQILERTKIEDFY